MSRTDKLLTIRITGGDERVSLDVIDDGIGTSAENLTRIFSHGFTTRRAGSGHGATFTLDLPINSDRSAS